MNGGDPRDTSATKPPGIGRPPIGSSGEIADAAARTNVASLLGEMPTRPFVLACCSAVAIALASCSNGTTNGGADGAAGAKGDAGGRNGTADAANAGHGDADGAAGAKGNAGGGSGSAADAGDGGAGTRGPMCALDPTGTFTFHLHNGTNGTINLFLGCGAASIPIVLDTPAGALPAGPGTIGACGFTCDKIYGPPGYLPVGCTDCGFGATRTMAPGDTTDIGWDRRVYAPQTIDAACAPWPGQTCALGKAVSRSAVQSGSLRVCLTFVPLACGDPRDVPFTIDTTGNAATIEVAN